MVKVICYCSSCGGEIAAKKISDHTDKHTIYGTLSDNQIYTITMGDRTLDLCKNCYNTIGNLAMKSIYDEPKEKKS